eukprot:jgi/Botrbrau1/3931/Bobra.0365s0007.1
MADQHLKTALKYAESFKAQVEPLLQNAKEAVDPLIAKAKEHIDPLLIQAKPHVEHVWEKVSPELTEIAHRAEVHLEGIPHWQLVSTAFLATLVLVGLAGGAKRVVIWGILLGVLSLVAFYYTEHVHIPPVAPTPPAPVKAAFIPEPVVHYDE